MPNLPAHGSGVGKDGHPPLGNPFSNPLSPPFPTVVNRCQLPDALGFLDCLGMLSGRHHVFDGGAALTGVGWRGGLRSMD